ncbi:hypothetical protein [Alloacidobacterium sp.]|uniref:hypothetical protein n=1 Tax=Alloacidobacterium sp. TaxID=2951999 RepID=UPI002D37DD58|nr:hypothetical protein [Alloacidobacterium sp.]HYK37769.1 hypothetical protein [Alloacidobacterium sp.]
MEARHDSDSRKGAVESQSPGDTAPRPDLHSVLADQLPHRGADPMIKDADEDNDTDFPEPGRVPEHSGQHK